MTVEQAITAPVAASGSVNYVGQPPGTASTAPQLESLTRRAAGLRDVASLAVQDTEALHIEATALNLGDRAARISLNRTLAAMLDELADAGMSWAEIAGVAAVTPAAVRKWRRGGDAAGAKRMAVAELLALLEMLAEFLVPEPVAYLISPVLPETTLTVMDLLRAGRQDLVLELASQRKPATAVLDEFQPDWRTGTARRFIVRADDDGERALVPLLDES